MSWLAMAKLAIYWQTAVRMSEVWKFLMSFKFVLVFSVILVIIEVRN